MGDPSRIWCVFVSYPCRIRISTSAHLWRSIRATLATMMATTPFLNIFVTSLKPVLQVLILAAIGVVLAVNGVDVLSPDARRHLNDVVFYIFMPMLFGANFAKFVTLETLAALWFMPLNVFLTFLIGSALGWAVNRFTRAPQHLCGVVLGCCATGNLGNLAFIMIPAVCYGKETPFGDVDACLGRAMAYATLSMAFGQIFMWSYVYNIMRRYSSSEAIDQNMYGVTGITENCVSLPMSMLQASCYSISNHNYGGKST